MIFIRDEYVTLVWFFTTAQEQCFLDKLVVFRFVFCFVFSSLSWANELQEQGGKKRTW